VAGAPFKPNDLVLTPTGRAARVEELRADGRRDIRYIDREGGVAALFPKDLTLLAVAPVIPWKTRVIR
jgi:hypothetical protein